MGVQMPRQTAFIFDVDGTLTPSRQEMDKEFQKWFTQFQEKNEYLACKNSPLKP